MELKQVCNRCIMDYSASDIKFDEDGNCNYCSDLVNLLLSEKQNTNSLSSFIDKIKFEGRNKEYDCIIGISGGIDSSFVLIKAIEFGLRPLAVHMDNGWNSELAQNNIFNIIDKLKIDLYTHVIEWEEYRKLMEAFFDADVIDVELLYDNAMTAVNYNLASKYGIKYILSGSNNSTEGMSMPYDWNWFKFDFENIKDIAKRNGNVRLKTFPYIDTKRKLYFNIIKGIRWVPFLDYFDYNKENAIEMLEREYSFKRYPYKHYESIFTRFYQGFILPTKFGIDKRRLHLSTLIISNQLTRNDALEQMSLNPYHSEIELSDDKEYFLKKMNWNMDKLDQYLRRPQRSHLYYRSELNFYNLFYKNKKDNVFYTIAYNFYKKYIKK